MSKHIPVMLYEAINALNIVPNGFYIDCTFGRGGHSKEILKRTEERMLAEREELFEDDSITEEANTTIH